MGSVQSRDNVDILVHGCGAGKLIRKYSQTLWTNSRESNCLKIKVSRSVLGLPFSPEVTSHRGEVLLVFPLLSQKDSL